MYWQDNINHLKGKTISVDQANKLRQIFNRIPDRSLDALRRKKIPFLSGLALSRMIQNYYLIEV